MMKKAFILGTCLLLAGCVFGTSAPSTFYTLRAKSSVEPISQTTVSVGVAEVNLPTGLDRAQIVLRSQEALQLTISETHRWGEPLDTEFQRALVNNLIGYLPKAFVKPKTFSSEQFKYTVWIDIDQMTGQLNGDATLSVWWQINNANGIRLKRQYTVLTAPASDTYDTYIAAQSGLLSDLARQIAVQISNL